MRSAAFRSFFTTLRFLSDFVFSFLTILAAYAIRFRYEPGGPEVFQEYFRLAVIFTLVTVTYMNVFEMYAERHHRSGVDELFGTLKAATLSFLIVIALTFYYRGYEFSRLSVTYAVLLSYALLAGSRMGILSFERRLMKKGHGVKKLAIVGTGIHFDLLVDRITGHRELGYELIGYFEENPAETLRGAPLLGSIDEAPRFIESRAMDEAIITLNSQSRELLQTIIDACDRNHVSVSIAANLLELMVGPREIEDLFGVPLIRFKGMRIKGLNAALKRAADLVVGGAMLTAAAPAIGLCAIGVKLSSPGPIFFAQRRVGLDDREFLIYKLRSMRLDAEKDGPQWSRPDEDRTFPFGRIMRRLSLDELPQLLNVVRGEMSLVGPRPERQVFVDEFQKGIPRYLERHRVKTGLTGWAQVNGLRGATSIEDRTQYDLYYIENWTFWFDIRILLMTVAEVVREALKK